MKITVKEKLEKIDWDKSQLVCGKYHTNGDYIIQTNKKHEGCFFEGIDLTSGVFSNRWNKEECKLFTGSITIQND